MKTQNKDNFSKIRFGYTAVLVTVLSVVCVVLLGVCLKTVAYDKNKMDNNFKNYYQTVENKLGVFRKIKDAVFANGDVRKFCGDLTESYNVQDAVDVGKLIKSFEKFVVDGEYGMVLTNLEDEMCATGKGIVRLQEVCEDLMLSDDEIISIRNNHKDDSYYIYNKESGVIRLIFRHRYLEAEDADFYYFITADVNVLMPDKDFVIADASEKYRGRSGNATASLLGKSYIIESATVPGLTYKYNATYGNVFVRMILIAFILICIAGIFFRRKIVEKILNIAYAPIIKVAGQNSEDENSWADAAWDKSAGKLIDDADAMRNDLELCKIRCKKNYLRNLLYDIEDYREKYIALYDLEYLNMGNRVVMMDFTNKSDSSMCIRLSAGEFAAELEDRISRNVSGELVSVNDGRYVYITDVCDKDELRDRLAGVLEFAVGCKLEAFIAVGDRVDTLRDVKASFRNAIDCMERRNAFPSRFVAFSSELTNENSSFYYPIDVEVQLIDNIVIGNQEVVDEILGKVLAKNLYEISLSAEKLRELKIVMVGTINRALNRMNKDVSDIFGENTSVYLEIGASRNKEEFAKNIRHVLGLLCSYNGNVSSEPKQDKIARDILSYIEANFSDTDLSLEKIARIFFISPNHVSRVMKNKIGKSYKEYLNDVRINEAKRLLKNTPMTVVSIANNVGYSDVRAFNRLFKKRTNQTPNEYRISD